MRWPPVSLTIGTSYFSATSAIRRSWSGRGDAALHLRDHGERAVPLDVGVHPVVDEPGVPLVDVLVGPHHLQQRRQAHLALGVLLAVRGQRGEHRRRPTAAPARGWPPSAPACPSGCRARTSARPGPPRPRRRRPTRRSGRPAPCRSRSPCRPGSGPSPRRRSCSRRRPRRTIVALGDAVAVADLGVVGELGDARPRPAARRGRTAAPPAPRAAAARGRTPASGTRPS